MVGLIGALSVTGCDEGAETGATSTATVAASATAAPSASASAAAEEKPSLWPPMVWEQARAAVLDDRPERPVVKTKQLKPLYPACANHDARKYLRDKLGDDYRKALADAERENEAARKEADAEWEKANAAWEKGAKQLDKTLASGAYATVVEGAVEPASFGPAGKTASLKPAAAEDDESRKAFRAALAKLPDWKKPFQCEVIAAMRLPRILDARTREAAKAKGVSPEPTNAPVDLIACGPPHGGYMAVLIEIPVYVAKAKVAVEGESARIEGYTFENEPYADEELRKLFEAKQHEQLEGRLIEVRGVSRLYRGPGEGFTFGMLQMRGVDYGTGQSLSSRNPLWIATFERPCIDEGLPCSGKAGGEAPMVKLLPLPEEKEEPAEERKAEPSRPTKERKRDRPATKLPEPDRGIWENAAREADPSLAEIGLHRQPWSQGVFPKLLDKAAIMKSFPKAGAAAGLVPPPEEDDSVLEAFRAALEKRGGIKPWTCTVREMGQEINPPKSDLIDAALDHAGKSTEEASQYNIVCRGDEQSFLGSILLFVPSYLAAAVVDGDNVKEYRLSHHGHFDESLREKLMKVGIGSKLEITGVGRLWRSETRNVVFRQKWPLPMWGASVGHWQCPHEGAGCGQYDGVKMPVVKAKKIEWCDVEGYSYEP
jgi:hypothetical protein